MQISPIVSPDNPTFKMFMKLSRSKGIKRHGVALFSGAKQVQEVVEEFREKCSGVILKEGLHDPESFAVQEIPIYSLSAKLYGQIDLFNTRGPILLVKVAPMPAWEGNSIPEGCTLCIPFQDPSNVGAVIRSAAAFAVERVLVLEESAHPFHPKSVRAAGSSLFRISIWKGPSIHDLSLSHVPVVTLSPDGEDVEAYRFPLNFYLIPGMEGPGLPKGFRSDASLAIPMASGVDSLNAPLATGIALYRWRRSLGWASAQ
jgi:tRNA G18 (ribose-2'-O)-methylase SpoU